MVMKIIIFLIVGIAVIGIFGNIIQQGNMGSAIQNIQASVATVAYAGELSEIRSIVNDFIKLKQMKNSENSLKLSAELDERIHNLELVAMYCDEEISTQELLKQNNPYKKLQQICPTLDNVSFSKAIELFNLI